jgi:hypothetical protein
MVLVVARKGARGFVANMSIKRRKIMVIVGVGTPEARYEYPSRSRSFNQEKKSVQR